MANIRWDINFPIPNINVDVQGGEQQYHHDHRDDDSRKQALHSMCEQMRADLTKILAAVNGFDVLEWPTNDQLNNIQSYATQLHTLAG